MPLTKAKLVKGGESDIERMEWVRLNVSEFQGVESKGQGVRGEEWNVLRNISGKNNIY